ncbi:hypothetical protein Q8A73_005292 [Channa argus]|nr:hypothetical protein Q8A73_005292 [Channa argus]
MFAVAGPWENQTGGLGLAGKLAGPGCYFIPALLISKEDKKEKEAKAQNPQSQSSPLEGGDHTLDTGQSLGTLDNTTALQATTDSPADTYTEEMSLNNRAGMLLRLLQSATCVVVQRGEAGAQLSILFAETEALVSSKGLTKAALSESFVYDSVGLLVMTVLLSLSSSVLP